MNKVVFVLILFVLVNNLFSQSKNDLGPLLHLQDKISLSNKEKSSALDEISLEIGMGSIFPVGVLKNEIDNKIFEFEGEIRARILKNYDLYVGLDYFYFQRNDMHYSLDHWYYLNNYSVGLKYEILTLESIILYPNIGFGYYEYQNISPNSGYYEKTGFGSKFGIGCDISLSKLLSLDVETLYHFFYLNEDGWKNYLNAHIGMRLKIHL